LTKQDINQPPHDGKEKKPLCSGCVLMRLFTAALKLNRPLSSRQVKKEKLRHEGLVPVSKGSQAL